MRKQRTREQIVEDLGFNHIERHALRTGYTLVRHLKGKNNSSNGFIQTFNERGEVQKFRIFFQLKSTDNIEMSLDKKSFVFNLSVHDLELWLYETTKMILILYDAQEDIAYFMDLQIYFKGKSIEIDENHEFLKVYISPDNVVTTESFQKLTI